MIIVTFGNFSQSFGSMQGVEGDAGIVSPIGGKLPLTVKNDDLKH